MTILIAPKNIVKLEDPPKLRVESRVKHEYLVGLWFCIGIFAITFFAWEAGRLHGAMEMSQTCSFISTKFNQ